MNAAQTLRSPDWDNPGKVLDYTGRVVALITSGEIDPKRRIGEASLATRLKVSRTAIRSALEHLEVVGLVERRPRAGTFLRTISVAEFCDAMDIRAALEALAASQAAVRAGKGDLAELDRLAAAVDKLSQRRNEGEIGIIPDLTALDLEFHWSLATLSGNARLATTLQQQRVIEFTFSIASQVPSEGLRRFRRVPTHREMVKAISSREPGKAAAVARQHILRTKENRTGISYPKVEPS